MQKIREVGGEAYSYASDYEIIGKIKQFADKHCICVLVVHHTRKQDVYKRQDVWPGRLYRSAEAASIGTPPLEGHCIPSRGFWQ